MCLCGLLLSRALEANSALTHEAINDSAGEHNIAPLLLERFPQVTPEVLIKAHAYAYAGGLIRDMADLDEYAFALGALAHYVADNQGYANGINPSVAIEYPKLERKFGKAPTYATIPSRTSGWNSASTCFRWRAATTRRSLITISTASRSQSRFSSASATLIPSRLSISSAIWISLWGLTAAPLSTVTPEMTRSAGKAKKAELMKVQPA